MKPPYNSPPWKGAHRKLPSLERSSPQTPLLGKEGLGVVDYQRVMIYGI
jgi:hypothetical protein